MQSMERIRRYFAWAGFRAPDLVLHVIETDDQLRAIVRAFLVDFADLSFPIHRPERPHRYELIQVPSERFRHVLRHRLSWAALGGVQALRDPDAHNHDFWAHFKERLPAPLPGSEAANDQGLLLRARQGAGG